MIKKLLLLALMLSVVSIAFGQEIGKPFFATPDACVSAKPGTFTEYAPFFTDNLAKWVKMKNEGQATLVQDGKTYCAEEWTLEGGVGAYRIIRWPDGLGPLRSATGKMADPRCGNGVRRLWEVPPPPAPPSVASSPPQSPPPQQQVVQGPPACLPPGGSPETGFTVTAADNGVVALFVDDQPYISGTPLPSGPGIHTFEARVSGSGGPDAVCKRTWEATETVDFSFPQEPEKKRDILKWIPCVGFVAHPSWGRAIYCGAVVGGGVGIGGAIGGAAALAKIGFPVIFAAP